MAAATASTAEASAGTSRARESDGGSIRSPGRVRSWVGTGASAARTFCSAATSSGVGAPCDELKTARKSLIDFVVEFATEGKPSHNSRWPAPEELAEGELDRVVEVGELDRVVVVGELDRVDEGDPVATVTAGSGRASPCTCPVQPATSPSRATIVADPNQTRVIPIIFPALTPGLPEVG